jgi:hypothetical protein
MYAMTGLGAEAAASASANVSLTAGSGVRASSSGQGESVFGRTMARIRERLGLSPPCMTQADHEHAVSECHSGRGGAAAVAMWCARASQVVCPTPSVVTPAAQVLAPPGVTAAFLVRPPIAPAGKPGIVSQARPGAYQKLPVPAAAPVPAVVLEEEPHGIPTWVWIAGGVAVLGTAAVLYKRKKAA